MRRRAFVAMLLCIPLDLSCAPILAEAADGAAPVAVGPQYATTHVYVAPEDLDRFAASFVATFGGLATGPAVTTVTPTASLATWRAIRTPVGNVSLFGYKTPIPYPFGGERTGYLVADMDAAIRAARAAGADVIVEPFPDPIGLDAIIQWPGGVNMQLYWHTAKPNYAALKSVPENRVYVSADRADAFVRDFTGFSGGKVTSDDKNAPGVEIGRPNDTYRRIRIESGFGKISVQVTDGQLPYPYGREMAGYEVPEMGPALHKAMESGATVLVHPYTTGDREAAIVAFPGGYIAEIHAPVRK